jgi:hypothetical protein
MKGERNENKNDDTTTIPNENDYENTQLRQHAYISIVEFGLLDTEGITKCLISPERAIPRYVNLEVGEQPLM